MNPDMTTNLATYSVVLTYSAMAVYVIAFISFALDVAKRSGNVAAAAGASADAAPAAGAAEGKTVATVRGGTVVLERVDAGPADSVRRGTKFERVGMAMTILALVLHVGSVVLRGVAADRVPWGNMFEFSLTGTALIILIFCSCSSGRT